MHPGKGEMGGKSCMRLMQVMNLFLGIVMTRISSKKRKKPAVSA